MVFVTGEQDKYNYIFPAPIKQAYFDKEYNLALCYPSTLFELFNFTKNGTADITILNNPTFLKDEYTLTVNEKGISIVSNGECGIFRAVSSLCQIINHGSVKFCDIHDKPQFQTRSFMYDISRGRKPRVVEIKRIIDYLSRLKYNELQLYMEDFCFLYPGFEDIIDDHNILTPKDIIELDEYAKARFIDLVPNQNGLGHMATWLHTKKYAHLEVGYEAGINTDTINITSPEAFELITKIYDGLLPYFSADRVHIGLDEAYGLGKYELEQVCNEIGKTCAFCDWLNKLSDYCKDKYGKRVLFWSDMIRDDVNAYEAIPNDAIPVEWDYADIEAQFIEMRCDKLQKSGHNYYVAPSTATVTSISGRSNDCGNNIRYMAETGYKYGANGFMLTAWGNDGHQQFFVNELFPITLAAQYSWNTGIKQHGGWRKTVFAHNACSYIDKNVYNGAKVAKLLYDLNNYYFLEPEFIHDGTMCAYALHMPLWETKKADFFDFAQIEQTYHFENIINYVSKLSEQIDKLTFNERLKREIKLGASLIILCANYNILKINQTITKNKQEELNNLSLWVEKEFGELWLYRNYPAGLEITLNKLASRRQELYIK